MPGLDVLDVFDFEVAYEDSCILCEAVLHLKDGEDEQLCPGCREKMEHILWNEYYLKVEQKLTEGGYI